MNNYCYYGESGYQPGSTGHSHIHTMKVMTPGASLDWKRVGVTSVQKYLLIPRAVREDQRLGASVEGEAHPGRRIRKGLLKKAAFEGGV